jgi:ketosteroid isomerase-like protein
MAGTGHEQVVRDLWVAWERDGVDGLRRVVDEDVEWRESGGAVHRWREALDEYALTVSTQRSAVPHGWECHGDCVLVHGSLRTFRDGGFVDVQPSWVYFFRDDRLVRAVAYSSRDEALAAIDEHCASAK